MFRRRRRVRRGFRRLFGRFSRRRGYGRVRRRARTRKIGYRM